MTFDVEVVLKGRDFAVTEAVTVGHEEAGVTDEVVREALVEILRAIERADNPQAPRDRAVSLQGFSWIVEPSAEDAVVIAIEIPMGAAVAGPFRIPQHELDQRITRVLRGGG